MEAPNKKTIRSTKEQISYLCRYMAEHPEFAAGDYRSPLGARQMAEEWIRLKNALGELGPQRTVDQWKICWRDQKRKARVEGGSHAQAVSATGNSVPVPDVSDNSMLVLSAIGPEMAVGMGPGESPIGVSKFSSVVEEVIVTPLPGGSGVASSSTTELNSIGVEVPVDHQYVQQSAPRRRARRRLPPERFIDAQLELNELIRELINEVRRSNELKEEHLNILRRPPSQ